LIKKTDADITKDVMYGVLWPLSFLHISSCSVAHRWQHLLAFQSHGDFINSHKKGVSFSEIVG
jgi:hypothetical protein